MVLPLALGVPPTPAQGSQVSKLATERNQSQKEEQTKGCHLNLPREDSASYSLSGKHRGEFLWMEGTSKSLLSSPHNPFHTESKQKSDI